MVRIGLAVGLALWVATQGAAADDPVRFDRDVLPILADHCFACHGPDAASREADLRLDDPDGVLDSVIVAGDLAGSELYQRVISADPDIRMPPKSHAESLTDHEIQRLARWIEQGASWTVHWSLVAPQSTPLPQVSDPSWPANPIDHFVLAELDKRAWSPSGRARREALLRRVSLDLTGLPPSPTDIRSFEYDTAPGAYERAVDRLLASPRYGERMAVEWLDAARYADTHGYLFDTQRSMWRWRDWVIEAFNANKPFDEFTVEQLAGDLLPDPTLNQRIATGFHRNHIINNEAGAIPQEYLVENVVDRVNTTATVWLGLTVACAQCHDHKYDPITQKEYYGLYAFFNNIPEVGLDGLNTNARPLIKAPTSRDTKHFESLQREIAQSEQTMESLTAEIAQGQQEWESTVETGSNPPIDGLSAHWCLDGSPQDEVKGSIETVFEAAEPSFADGMLGRAASLDGLLYLNGGDRFSLTASDAITLSVWLRPRTNAGRLTIVSRMLDADQLYRGYALQLVEGFPALYLIHTFPDNMLQVQGSKKIDPNRWTHLAVTYDGSGKAGGVKIYLDGEPQQPGLQIDQLTEPIDVEASPFWIGNGHPAAKFKGEMDEVRIYNRVLSADEIQQLPGLSIESLLAVAAPVRNAHQTQRIRAHYLQHHAPARWSEPFERLSNMRQELETLERDLPTVMVMAERADRQPTKLLIRGAYNQPGDPVSAHTPVVLPPMQDGMSRDRLGLARWLVDKDQPLTARVMVNRIWQLHFGRGLVETSDDFGIRGSPPTHPQLLDYLAVEFRRSGWDVKRLQRLIVTSSTYCQTTRVSSEYVTRDPDNLWLARGARFRMHAEFIRDQALAASGLLVKTIGGPSVRPYQPAGLWREVAFDFSGGNLTAQIYRQDTGASLYRRSMYTFWKRTSPPPSLLTFDAPDRERCVVRRLRTNTPLQALVLLNDPTYVEAARKLAERMWCEGGESIAARIDHGYKLVLGRAAREIEIDLLTTLFEEQLDRFTAAPEAATELLAEGESTADARLDPTQLAALTIVAEVLLNLDETLTR